MAYETLGLSSVVTYTQPLFVFCKAVVFLSEQAKKIRVLGVLTGFFGVTMILFRNDTFLEGINISVLFLLFVALLWAISINFYKKFLSHVEPVIATTITFCVGGVVTGLLDLVVVGGYYFHITMDYLPVILNALLSVLVWVSQCGLIF